MTGDFRKIVPIWELDNFASVERGLAACGSPDGQAILARIADLVEAESIEIMASTSYG